MYTAVVCLFSLVSTIEQIFVTLKNNIEFAFKMQY
jgi:hypothetical protein